MADVVLNKHTTIPGEEVITRAVQFFSTAQWRATSQSPRAATFEGTIPIPWGMMLLMIVGYACCVVPGIIIQITLIRKMRRFQNLVVTVTQQREGTDVVLTYPKHARKLAERFLAALPGSPHSVP